MEHFLGAATYRTKPVQIQAIELTWKNWDDICAFIEDKKAFIGGCYIDPETMQPFPDSDTTSEILGLRINTLEGTMLASQGDFIIRGLRGEYYPCKPDVFHAKYELIHGQDRKHYTESIPTTNGDIK
jgi:hypothetical protein